MKWRFDKIYRTIGLHNSFGTTGNRLKANPALLCGNWNDLSNHLIHFVVSNPVEFFDMEVSLFVISGTVVA